MSYDSMVSSDGILSRLRRDDLLDRFLLPNELAGYWPWMKLFMPYINCYYWDISYELHCEGMIFWGINLGGVVERLLPCDGVMTVEIFGSAARWLFYLLVRIEDFYAGFFVAEVCIILLLLAAPLFLKAVIWFSEACEVQFLNKDLRLAPRAFHSA